MSVKVVKVEKNRGHQTNQAGGTKLIDRECISTSICQYVIK